MDQSDSLIGISSKSVRLQFIRKVFSIVSVMLFITACFVCSAFLIDGYADFYVRNIWIAIVAVVIVIVTSFSIVCYKSVARESPKNYLFLTAYIVSESYLVSGITMHYSVDEVSMAAGLTVAMVCSLTLYAFRTKTDFTMMGGFLLTLVVLLLLGGIICLFYPNHIMYVVITCATLLCFSLYLVYDVQLLAGGRKNEYSKDDYVVASLQIFIDILRIFLELLKLISLIKRRRGH